MQQLLEEAKIYALSSSPVMIYGQAGIEDYFIITVTGEMVLMSASICVVWILRTMLSRAMMRTDAQPIDALDVRLIGS